MNTTLPSVTDRGALILAPALTTGEAALASAPGTTVAEPDVRIEIVLPDGTALRVSETIGAATLHRVLAALRR